jgi:hypothetical protein
MSVPKSLTSIRRTALLPEIVIPPSGGPKIDIKVDTVGSVDSRVIVPVTANLIFITNPGVRVDHRLPQAAGAGIVQVIDVELGATDGGQGDEGACAEQSRKKLKFHPSEHSFLPVNQR